MVAVMATLGPAATKETIAPCPECKKISRVGFLKEYCVSLDSSVIFCDNNVCCYTAESREEVHSHISANQNDINDFLNSILTNPEYNTSPGEDLTGAISIDELSTSNCQQTSIKSGDVLDKLSSTSISLDNDLSLTSSLDDCSNIPPSNHKGFLPGSTTDGQTISMGVVAENCQACSSEGNDDHQTFSSSVHPFASKTVNPSLVEHIYNSPSPSASHESDASPQNLPSRPATSKQPLGEVILSPSHHASAVTNHSSKYFYVMLWCNIDALCWLDVLLANLCYNQSLRSILDSLSYSSLIKKLLVAYDEAQALIAPLQDGNKSLLHTVIESDELRVKRGGGYCMDTPSLLLDSLASSTTFSSQQISSAKRKIHLSGIKLECAREELWQFLEPTLRCERGKDDSPVFAFPLLVGSNKSVEKLFLTEFTWSTRCTSCHHEQIDRKREVMITFPKISEFKMNQQMVHTKDCIKCLAPNQCRRLEIQKTATNLVIHFVDGMKDSDMDSLAFTSRNGMSYAVTAVVEYRTSPNHFVLWQRQLTNGKAGNWMCYDDLRSQYAQFSTKRFLVPAHNIHIVFWEALESGRVTHSVCEPSSLNSTSSIWCSIADGVESHVNYTDSGRTPSFNQSDSMQTLPGSFTSELRKPLVPSDVHATNNTITSRKPVKNKKAIPLLSAKIGSSQKPKFSNLTQTISVPQAVMPTSGTSNQEIMSAFAQSIPVAPTVDKPQSLPSASRVTTSAASKSYLDMVQPLLRKHKEQKGTSLGAYVPKSKRQIEDKSEQSKRKRVKFTGLSYAKSSSTPLPNRQRVPKVGMETSPIIPSPVPSTKNNPISSACSENTSPAQGASNTVQASDGMQSLEELLQDIW
ncbi:SUMO-specific isopeptidase USPL1-like [Watersipora subatra]|uniref:SUMO-specific isopeptidase USPL1-like n=1 Tax=Watersipora subatra TaxID=2589382 RepID=UPI00355C8376